ncbi:hypothetical protein E1301_Tti015874 [Triplophysa tibetana]|uniref:Uncharacterized protein n=1 Tax=Triplophysa tibetana TaxID=1572043 RepID=A0A5A9PHH5_9TELE|nr:hypothetical protein E1301_Tti015874 [Triplophysa tibetana]
MRRRDSQTPRPSMHQPPSRISSYASALSFVPAIVKWTVLGLRKVLSNANVQFSREKAPSEQTRDRSS